MATKSIYHQFAVSGSDMVDKALDSRTVYEELEQLSELSIINPYLGMIVYVKNPFPVYIQITKLGPQYVDGTALSGTDNTRVSDYKYLPDVIKIKESHYLSIVNGTSPYYPPLVDINGVLNNTTYYFIETPQEIVNGAKNSTKPLIFETKEDLIDAIEIDPSIANNVYQVGNFKYQIYRTNGTNTYWEEISPNNPDYEYIISTVPESNYYNSLSSLVNPIFDNIYAIGTDVTFYSYDFGSDEWEKVYDYEEALENRVLVSGKAVYPDFETLKKYETTNGIYTVGPNPESYEYYSLTNGVWKVESSITGGYHRLVPFSFGSKIEIIEGNNITGENVKAIAQSSSSNTINDAKDQLLKGDESYILEITAEALTQTQLKIDGVSFQIGGSDGASSLSYNVTVYDTDVITDGDNITYEITDRVLATGGNNYNLPVNDGSSRKYIVVEVILTCTDNTEKKKQIILFQDTYSFFSWNNDTLKALSEEKQISQKTRSSNIGYTSVSQSGNDTVELLDLKVISGKKEEFDNDEITGTTIFKYSVTPPTNYSETTRVFNVESDTRTKSDVKVNTAKSILTQNKAIYSVSMSSGLTFDQTGAIKSGTTNKLDITRTSDVDKVPGMTLSVSPDNLGLTFTAPNTDEKSATGSVVDSITDFAVTGPNLSTSTLNSTLIVTTNNTVNGVQVSNKTASKNFTQTGASYGIKTSISRISPTPEDIVVNNTSTSSTISVASSKVPVTGGTFKITRSGNNNNGVNYTSFTEVENGDLGTTEDNGFTYNVDIPANTKEVITTVYKNKVTGVINVEEIGPHNGTLPTTLPSSTVSISQAAASYVITAKDNEGTIITSYNVPAKGETLDVNYSWEANNGAIMTNIVESADDKHVGSPYADNSEDNGIKSKITITPNYLTNAVSYTYTVKGKGKISGGEEFTTTASNTVTFRQTGASYSLESLKVTKIDGEEITENNDLTGESYTVNSSAHDIEITGVLGNTVGTHYNTVTPTQTTSTDATVTNSGDIIQGTTEDGNVQDTFKLNVTLPENTSTENQTTYSFKLNAGNNNLFNNKVNNQIFNFLQDKLKIQTGNIYIGLLYVGDSDGVDNILTYIGTPGTNKLLAIGDDTTGTISWEIEVEGYTIPVKYIYQTVDPSTVTFENGTSTEIWNCTALASEIEGWDEDAKEYIRVHNMVLIPGDFNGGAIQYSFLGSFNMSEKDTLSNGYSILKGSSTSTLGGTFEVKLSQT